MASANGERARPRNLPAAQADRTGARHHQEPRHVAVPGAWPGKSPCGLPAASAGAQPVLGQHPAAPCCRSGSNGDAGNRMTATGRASSAMPGDSHDAPAPIHLPITSTIHIPRLRTPPGDTSRRKAGLGDTLLRGGDEEGDAAVNHLNASKH